MILAYVVFPNAIQFSAWLRTKCKPEIITHYVSKTIADMLKKVLPLMSLRAFVVAGRYERFKIAAETLNISPGAISRNLPPSATAADALKRAVGTPTRVQAMYL